MRLPDFHPLVLALVDKLGLGRRQFYNVDVDPGTGSGPDVPVPPVTYSSFTGRTWTYGDDSPDFREPDKRGNSWIRVNRVQVRRSDYAAGPERVNEGFHLTGDEVRAPVVKMVDDALEAVRDYYSDLVDGRRVNKPFEEWVEGWARVIRDFDGYSMGGFLRDHAGLSDEAIEAVGTLENMSSRLHLLLPQLPEPQRHQPRRPLLGDTRRQLAPAARPPPGPARRGAARPPHDPPRVPRPQPRHRPRGHRRRRIRRLGRGRADRRRERSTGPAPSVDGGPGDRHRPVLRPALRGDRPLDVVQEAPRRHRDPLRPGHQGAAGVQPPVVGVHRGRLARGAGPHLARAVRALPAGRGRGHRSHGRLHGQRTQPHLRRAARGRRQGQRRHGGDAAARQRPAAARPRRPTRHPLLRRGLRRRQPQPVHVLPLAPGRGQHRRRRPRLVLLVRRRRALGLHAERRALRLRPAQPPGPARPPYRGVLHRAGRHEELGP